MNTLNLIENSINNYTPEKIHEPFDYVKKMRSIDFSSYRKNIISFFAEMSSLIFRKEGASQ
ncbi:MAG: hypothetical protein HZB30_08865 [Nitrospirae bacterium]|nr:hypothetical protein [Nitrospirota bacterium]